MRAFTNRFFSSAVANTRKTVGVAFVLFRYCVPEKTVRGTIILSMAHHSKSTEKFILLILDAVKNMKKFYWQAQLLTVN